jgi:hypothetical protein
MLILRQDPSLEPQPPARGGLAYQAAGGLAQELPETRCAVNGELRIAYQVTGTGVPDIVFVPGLVSHVDLWWEEPITSRFFRRLASLGPGDLVRQAGYRPVRPRAGRYPA